MFYARNLGSDREPHWLVIESTAGIWQAAGYGFMLVDSDLKEADVRAFFNVDVIHKVAELSETDALTTLPKSDGESA